jgi:hypothetical protein
MATLGSSPLEEGITEGENPVWTGWRCLHEALSTSRVVWECSSKWVVNFI